MLYLMNFLISSLIGAILTGLYGTIENFLAFELGTIFGGILIWIFHRLYRQHMVYGCHTGC